MKSKGAPTRKSGSHQCHYGKVTMGECFLSSGGDPIWVLKPTGMNQGRGVQLFQTIGQLDSLLSSLNQPKSSSFVVQKYLEKPLLVHGHKFDIRVFVLLDQEMNVFFFQEGYLRLSMNKYSLEDIDDIYTHLTNNAI